MSDPTTIRIVLVGWSDHDWRLYRQPQWIGQVRREPEAASLPRIHFDIEEEAYAQCLDLWKSLPPTSTSKEALKLLIRLGAVEVQLDEG